MKYKLGLVAFTTGLAFSVALAPAARGDLLVSYDIAAVNTNPSSVIVGSTAAGVSASAITLGPGINPTAFWNGTQGFFGANGFTTSSSEDSSQYFTFSVTASGSQPITYQSLTYGLFDEAYSPSFGLNGPQKWDLVYSLDNFTTPGTLITTDTVSPGSLNKTLNQVTFTTDVSAIGTQSGTVTFRLYAYDAGSSVYVGGLGNGSGVAVADRSWAGTGSDVMLNGTLGSVAAVPEPSTLVIAGPLAAAVLALHARRRVRRDEPA